MESSRTHFLKLTHYTNTSSLDVEDILLLLLLPLLLCIVTKLLPVGYSRTHFEAHPLHKYFMSWWWRYYTTTTTTTTTIITDISCDKNASHGMLKNSFCSSPTDINMSCLDSEERLLTLWSMLQTIYFVDLSTPPRTWTRRENECLLKSYCLAQYPIIQSSPKKNSLHLSLGL